MSALIGGIKETYGNAFSWGDLFVFAGTAAILQDGRPIAQLCVGRIDDRNAAPLGSAQVGLIYVT